MKIIVVIVALWCTGSISAGAQQDTLSGETEFKNRAGESGRYESRNIQRYQRCLVWSQWDTWTDNLSHHVRCRAHGDQNISSIGVADWGNKNIEARFAKGKTLYEGKHIPVTVEIDGQSIVDERLFWSVKDSEAILAGHTFALKLVDSMAHGQKVSLRLGPKQGRFRLDGARAAAEDFRRRVAGQ